MDKIKLHQGDITELYVDAIVNAANKGLMGGGGGVDGAIHRAAGKDLLRACRALNGCNTGDAKITKGYNLSAKFVIHTVGPIWADGTQNEETLLASCYRRSLELAIENGVKTIAFPNISTGIYDFSKQKAAEIAIHEVKSFLQKHQEIDQVVFVVFDYVNYDIYRKILGF